MSDAAAEREAKECEVERLGNEFKGAGAEGGGPDFGRAECGGDNDGETGSVDADVLAQGETVHSTHVQIGDHHLEVPAFEQHQRIARGGPPCDGESAPIQAGRDGLAHRRVVVDEQDPAVVPGEAGGARRGSHHAAAGLGPVRWLELLVSRKETAPGIVKWNTLPSPSVLSTQILPPWDSTMHLEM